MFKEFGLVAYIRDSQDVSVKGEFDRYFDAPGDRFQLHHPDTNDFAFEAIKHFRVAGFS